MAAPYPHPRRGQPCRIHERTAITRSQTRYRGGWSFSPPLASLRSTSKPVRCRASERRSPAARIACVRFPCTQAPCLGTRCTRRFLRKARRSSRNYSTAMLPPLTTAAAAAIRRCFATDFMSLVRCTPRTTARLPGTPSFACPMSTTSARSPKRAAGRCGLSRRASSGSIGAPSLVIRLARRSPSSLAATTAAPSALAHWVGTNSAPSIRLKASASGALCSSGPRCRFSRRAPRKECSF